MMIRHRHRSLPEIMARAKAEIERNPTITVYGWRDGREHNRRQAEPWAGFRHRLQKLGQVFITVRPSLDRFGEQLQRALAAMPAAGNRLPGLGAPDRPPRTLSVVPSLPEEAPRHPDLDVFDQAVADYEAQQDAEEDQT